MSVFYLDTQTNTRYHLGRTFAYGDINYTKQGATHETFIGLGFVKVSVQRRPNEKFYIVGSMNEDGSWNSTPRDLDNVKAKFTKKNTATAKALLTPSDWYYARKVELGTEVPQEISEYRTEVRLVHELREDAINACTDIPELEELITATGKIWDEELEEDVVNPAALPEWPTPPEELV